MLKTIAKQYLRRYSSTQLNLKERLQSFRTTESNPLNHNQSHHAQFYVVDETDRKQIFPPRTLPKSFEIQSKTFNELALMIRAPSLDVINCLRNIDYSKPTVRFVLYGPLGSGKTLSLAHILHYAKKDGFLLVHVPWASNWTKRCKESSISETKEEFFDTNLDAADWLNYFKIQNADILKNPDLVTSQEHVWNKRESTPKGSHLTTLIDYGINRVKYASNCVVILSNEIKLLSTSGVCKTLVAIDAINSFFYPKTSILTEKREIVHPEKLTVTEAIKNLTKFDWNNSVAVLVVDELAIYEQDQISYMPK